MRVPNQDPELMFEEMDGNPALLEECLGSPEGLGTLGIAMWAGSDRPVGDAAGLRDFLFQYRDRVLLPVELPAVRTAFFQACRYEVRELVEVDKAMGLRAELGPFAFASQSVGRSFLRRLRPLRDVRLLRRYESAVLRGQAYGWHTLVYGVVLAIYSLPLRQGLVGYVNQTMNGFLQTGAARLGLRDREIEPIREALLDCVPGEIQKICSAGLRCLPEPSDDDAPRLQ
ncbi:MAG: urease accessory UreF family protein [Limisphaerales bacterium]